MFMKSTANNKAPGYSTASSYFNCYYSAVDTSGEQNLLHINKVYFCRCHCSKI